MKPPPGSGAIDFDLSDVAAVGAPAPRMTEGSRIRKVPSLDREKQLWCGGPKRVEGCGSLGAWNDIETFSTPSV
jgi:hypothetical protein